MSFRHGSPFKLVSLAAFCLGFALLQGQTTKSSGDAARYRWVNVTNDAAYAPRDGAGALVFFLVVERPLRTS